MRAHCSAGKTVRPCGRNAKRCGVCGVLIRHSAHHCPVRGVAVSAQNHHHGDVAFVFVSHL